MRERSHEAKRQRTSRRVGRRSGSVLLVCVTLLVLLSIVGVAFLSKATDARLSARQAGTNTQLDLLADGLFNIAATECVRDLFNNGEFRPDSGYLTSPGETGGGLTVQPWLASRLPDVPHRSAAPGRGNPPYWPYVSAPFLGDAFASPYCPNGVPVRYARRRWALPDAVRLPDNSWSPALRFVDSQGGVSEPVVAADADGDGIADSGLVKLSPGPLEGITYYGAVRIIDNNSALNASVAWEPNPVTDPAGGLPGDFFPTNIDLRDLVAPGEMAALNAYRTGGAGVSLIPLADEQDPSGRWVASERQDFTFGSPGESLWMQLGRRLDNPGFADPLHRYQGLGVTDSMALAHAFCLPMQGVYPALAEQLLPLSSGRNATAARYAPWDVARWFNDRFAFNASGTNQGPSARPIRAILAARNPVSNFCPSKFNDRGDWRPGSRYVFGDVARRQGRAYVCVRAHVGTTENPPGEMIRPLTWVPQPWTSAPTKTGVNTADFPRLWLAYWSVMAQDAPHDAAGGAPPAGVAQDGTGLRMFRSSLRSDAKLSGAQEMILRAALAAVNTLQLRSGDFCPETGLGTVVSRTIDLPGSSGDPQYTVTVYGADRQPFMTEVFARNDANPQDDYVAVELFNPYRHPLVLRGWALATTARAILPVGGGPPRMRLTALQSTTEGPSNWSEAPPVVPGGGYLVLASSAVAPSDVSLPPATTTLRVVPDLVRALGQELVLLRPRRGDGTPSRSADPNDPINAFDEGTTDTPNLADRVPVDGYDFTNLSASGLAAPSEWHYVRPSDSAGGKAWHYVYPGPIRATGPAGGPAFLGTHVTVAGDTTDLSSLGRADANVLEPSSYRDVAVELNASGFPGPFKATAPGPNRFPFGAFARNGDILDVPFIGAYCVHPALSAPLVRPAAFVELNPATIDCAFADDDDPGDDVDADGMPVEQIGHFCPIDGADLAGPAHADDFGADPARWRYHWAMRLFDYLTVQCPQDDYLPDVDPAASDATVPPAPSAARYPSIPPRPVIDLLPVSAGVNPSNPAGPAEEAAPVEGLVNLNTAPWRVLAAIPWLPAPATPSRKALWLAENSRIAQAIVDYRDGSPATEGHGPFRTCFDLNRVALPDGTRLRDVLGDTFTSVFGPEQGRLAPYANGAAEDVVRGDFLARYLVMTRVSNLVTTRSDSFVVYVLTQGWRDAETAAPKLVAQRRVAALVDRTGVTPLDRSARVVRVPTD